jgi:hypothetical protein
MAKKPRGKLTAKELESNVLARLAAGVEGGVEYEPEMRRLRYEQNYMAYPNPQGPMAEDTDFKGQIAGIMAKMNRPMPAPGGSNNYYTQQQYDQAVQQAYPYDPIQHQLELDARMRQAEAMRMAGRMREQIPGSAPVLGQQFQPQESTFIDGRQYDRPQGPPMPFGMAFVNRVDRNAMRDSLYPYLQMLGLAVGERQR